MDGCFEGFMITVPFFPTFLFFFFFFLHSLHLHTDGVMKGRLFLTLAQHTFMTIERTGHR